MRKNIYVITCFNNISNSIMPTVLRVYYTEIEMKKQVKKIKIPIKICKMNRLTGEILEVAFRNT